MEFPLFEESPQYREIPHHARFELRGYGQPKYLFHILENRIWNKYLAIRPVTYNNADFTSLLERKPAHPSLVCMYVAQGLMRLAAQQVLFKLALERLVNDNLTRNIREDKLITYRTARVDRYVSIPSYEANSRRVALKFKFRKSLFPNGPGISYGHRHNRL